MCDFLLSTLFMYFNCRLLLVPRVNKVQWDGPFTFGSKRQSTFNSTVRAVKNYTLFSSVVLYCVVCRPHFFASRGTLVGTLIKMTALSRPHFMSCDGTSEKLY